MDEKRGKQSQFAPKKRDEPEQAEHHQWCIDQPAGLITEEALIEVRAEPVEPLILVAVHEPVATYVLPVHHLNATNRQRYGGGGE